MVSGIKKKVPSCKLATYSALSPSLCFSIPFSSLYLIGLFLGVFSGLWVLCFQLFLGILRYIGVFSLVFDWFRLFLFVFIYFLAIFECFWVRDRTYFEWEIYLHERHLPIIPLSSPYLPLLSIFHLYISGVCGCFRVRNHILSPYPTCTSVPLSISLVLHISSLV